jgi:two-component system, OmpR family, response regulator
MLGTTKLRALHQTADRQTYGRGEHVSHPNHILVVDHDGDVRETVCELLVDLGYRVSVAKDAKAMRAMLVGDGIELIVLDASTSDPQGLDTALDAKTRGIRLVMISGHPERMKQFHDRADQLLHKPFRRAELERAVQYALASDTFGQRKEDPD